jgi:ParB family chromosome partitioning protein
MSDDDTSIIHLIGGAVVTLADAERALKDIAIAESAETLFARAKDVDALFAAVKAKLTGMHQYIRYRDGLGLNGGDRKSEFQRSNSDLLPAIDPGNLIAHRWRKALKTVEKLQAAIAEAQERCRRICEQENLGTIRGTEGNGEFERYTPARYIELARQVLGEIDLDPASCELAQKTVQATRYFTVADDGLEQPWEGRVWLNPPYHRELAPRFIHKLIFEFEDLHVDAAIVLTNNSTDTVWFAEAANVCQAICFTTGRIHFDVPNGEPVMPTQGQAFFYFGPDRDRFVDVFKDIGLCVEPVHV